MKQYHPESKTFDDLVLDETGSLKTHGQGWIKIDTQEQINAISAAITNGGEVWLDSTGSLKTSPPRAPALRTNGTAMQKHGRWTKPPPPSSKRNSRKRCGRASSKNATTT